MEYPGHGPSVPVDIVVLPDKAADAGPHALLVLELFGRRGHLGKDDLGLAEIVGNELLQLIRPFQERGGLSVVGLDGDDGKGAVQAIQVGQFQVLLYIYISLDLMIRNVNLYSNMWLLFNYKCLSFSALLRFSRFYILGDIIWFKN